MKGIKSERVTGNPDANEQLLYFTSSSLLADDTRLVYISDRTGYIRDQNIKNSPLPVHGGIKMNKGNVL